MTTGRVYGYSPTCNPSYSFLTSARTREISSLVLDESRRALRSFSTASILRMWAETCLELSMRVGKHKSKPGEIPWPCFVGALQH